MSDTHVHDEQPFRAVAGSLSDAVVVMDADGRIVYGNAEIEATFGHRAADLVGRPAAELLDPGERSGHDAVLARLAAGRDDALPERVEIQGIHRDGRRLPLEATYGTYRQHGRRFFTGVFRDLSERRRTESRMQFQARLLDAVGEAVIATDPAGRILYWNAAAEELYGWSAEEVLGRPVEEVTPAEIARGQASEIMARLRAGDSWTGEFLVRDRSGREFPVMVTDSPVVAEDGSLVGIIGTSKEITQRKRAEEAQRFLAETGRVLASSLDHETTLGRVSRLAIPMLGQWCIVHLLERGGPTPVAHCTPPGQEPGVSTLESVLSGAGGVLERLLPLREPARLSGGHPALTEDARRRLDDLGIRDLLVVPLEVRDQPLGIITFARGPADRRYDADDARLAADLALRAAAAIDNARLYRDAEESDRAKTDFLAVVSHELRTPLNAITGYAELLTAGISGQLNDKQRKQIERIRVSAGHLAQLIDEILTFARMENGRDTLEAERTDVGHIVQDAVTLLQPAARAKGLSLSVDAPPSGPELHTDPGKLRQVVVNLVSNAVKYTESGAVDVTVRDRGEEGVEITVRDTGIGIPPEEQERIFEPFRQVQSPNTRTVGGTGLGLSVSRRLVDILGGTLRLESTPGEGSTFTVRLPARAAQIR